MTSAVAREPSFVRTPSLRRRIAFSDVMVILAVIPSLVVLGLLVGTVWISFRQSILNSAFTFQHYIELYIDPFAYRAFLNSLGFAFWTLLVAFFFVVPIAWIAERTDVRGKSIIYTLMTIGIFIPSFFSAMGWLFLLNPRIGMLNIALRQLFGFAQGPLSIVNVPGMGVIQGLGLASVVFVLTADSLRAMDAQLEDAARMSGASFVGSLRRVTLPLAWPGLLASGLYVFTIGIGAFDVPLVVGMSNRIYTFSTFLYVMSNPLNGIPRYGLVAAFASFMIVFALLLSWWYSRVLAHSRRYQVVTGKGYRPRLVMLGRWRHATWGFMLVYLLAAKIMPLLMMIWASLLSYFQPFSLEALGHLTFANYAGLDWSLLSRSLVNTAILMLTVPLLALAMSLIFSWVVLRSRRRFRLAFDFIAFLPHAVPSTIFAFVALVAALAIPVQTINLSGTLIPIIIVMSVAMLSFGTRITNAALIQLHDELEEAAQIAGASLFGTFRHIVFPLLKPALLFGWLWIALLTFRELTIPTVLFSANNVTFSTAVWGLWYSGAFDAAAAANLVMLGLLLPLVVLYLRCTERVSNHG